MPASTPHPSSKRTTRWAAWLVGCMQPMRSGCCAYTWTACCLPNLVTRQTDTRRACWWWTPTTGACPRSATSRRPPSSDRCVLGACQEVDGCSPGGQGNALGACYKVGKGAPSVCMRALHTALISFPYPPMLLLPTPHKAQPSPQAAQGQQVPAAQPAFTWFVPRTHLAARRSSCTKTAGAATCSCWRPSARRS